MDMSVWHSEGRGRPVQSCTRPVTNRPHKLGGTPRGTPKGVDDPSRVVRGRLQTGPTNWVARPEVLRRAWTTRRESCEAGYKPAPRTGWHALRYSEGRG